MFKKNFNISSRRKNNQKDKYESKSIVRIVVSLLIAIVAFVGTISLESYLLSDKTIDKVVVATQAINRGTMITEDNNGEYFKVINVKTSLKTPLTFSNVEDVKGKVLTNIEPGEMVTKNRFADTMNVEKDLVDPVEFTFTVTNVEDGVCGSIRAGDVCDIMYQSTENDLQSDASALLIENAYIIETYDSSGVKIDSSNTEAQSMYFKIYINRSEEAAINKIVSRNDVTVTKVVDQETTQKQTSHVAPGSENVSEPTEETQQQTNSEMNMNSWVDETLSNN